MRIFGLLISALFTLAPPVAFAAGCPIREQLHVFEMDGAFGYLDGARERVRIKPQFSVAYDFTPYGYGYADGHYINLEGQKLFLAFLVDNGPDDLADGLMRFRKDDKVGYLDECLHVVIPATFDYASRFLKGIAVACMGCVEVPLIPEDTEHTVMQGGKWGIIDLTGTPIVPIEHERDEIFKQADRMVGRDSPAN